MAFSKAKLKSNGDKSSSCFKPFLTGHMSDKCLPTRTLLQVSFRHICSSLTSSMGIPKWMRILYKISLLSKFLAFLNPIKSWCTAAIYSHFFSSIWRMQNIWSIVDLLRRNQHWWSPVISSAYGVNLDCRILDNILYVFDKSDMPLLLRGLFGKERTFAHTTRSVVSLY